MAVRVFFVFLFNLSQTRAGDRHAVFFRNRLQQNLRSQVSFLFRLPLIQALSSCGVHPRFETFGAVAVLRVLWTAR